MPCSASTDLFCLLGGEGREGGGWVWSAGSQVGVWVDPQEGFHWRGMVEWLERGLREYKLEISFAIQLHTSFSYSNKTTS